MTRTIRLSILILFPLFMQGQLSDYEFYKGISIQATQVAGTGHTDFPILIKHIDQDLRHSSHGGHVANVNGHDIVFSEYGGTDLLDHDLQFYDPSTGAIIVWVNVPHLSGTTNTTIRIHYGNSAISTNLSDKDTWSSGFEGVWHFDGSLEDKSENNDPLHEMNCPIENGVHGSSRNIPGSGSSLSNNRIYADIDGDLRIHGDLTLDAWVNLSSIQPEGYDNVIFSCGEANSGASNQNENYPYWLNLYETGPGQLGLKTFWEYGNDINVITQSTSSFSYSPGEWVKISMVREAGGINEVRYYVNGQPLGAEVSYSYNPNGGTNAYLQFGLNQQYQGYYLDGRLDEARIASQARSAEWILTDFNSQNKMNLESLSTLNSDPTRFYRVGSEISAQDNGTTEAIGMESGLSVPFNTSSDDGFISVDFDDNDQSFYAAGYVESAEAFGSSMALFSGNRDGVLAKYDGSGNLDWYTYIGGPGNEMITDVAVSSSGIAYVTGYFEDNAAVYDPSSGGTDTDLLSGQNYEAFVAAFDPDGTRRWIQSYGASNNDVGLSLATIDDRVYTVIGFQNFAGDIMLDGHAVPPIDNVVLPGYGSMDVGLGNTSSYALLAHDDQGNLLWKSYFGSDMDDIDIQSSNLDLYCDFQNADITIQSGQIYVASLFSKTESLYDATNNYFIFGNQGQTADDDIMFMEFSQNGTPLWQSEIWISGQDAKHVNITSNSSSLYLSATLDGSSGIYLNGNAPIFKGSGYDPVFFKADRNTGAIEWTRHLETTGSNGIDDYISDIHSNGTGTLHFTGSFRTDMSVNGDFPLLNQGPLTPEDAYDIFIGRMDDSDGSISRLTKAGRQGRDFGCSISSTTDRLALVGRSQQVDDFPGSPGSAVNSSTNLLLALGKSSVTSCPSMVSYPTDCHSATGTMMVSSNAVPGGVFFESSGNLAIDPSTGTLNLAVTPPALYLIQYRVGLCIDSIYFSVLPDDICTIMPSDASESNTPGDCGYAEYEFKVPVMLDSCDHITYNQTSGLASGSDYPIGTTNNEFSINTSSQTIERLYYGWNDDTRSPLESDYGPDGYTMDSGQIITGSGLNGGALASNPSSTPPNIRIADNGYFNYEGIDVEFLYAHNGSLADGHIVEKKGSFAVGFDTFIIFHGFGIRLSLVDPADPLNILTVSYGPFTYPPIDSQFHKYRFRYDPNDGNIYFFYDDVLTIVQSTSLGPGWVLAYDPLQDFHISEDYTGIGQGVVDELRLRQVTMASTALCSFDVTITDNEAPTIDSFDPSIQLSGSCSAIFGSPNVSDNCSGPYSISSDISPTVSGVGTHSITWTVSDQAGNTIEETRTLTVDDNTAPVADLASLPDVDGQCDLSLSPPTATDNCQGSITGTTATVFPITVQGDSTITWIYDDGNGNTSTQSQNILVADTTKPHLITYPDTTVFADENGEYLLQSYFAEATDNCTDSLIRTIDDLTFLGVYDGHAYYQTEFSSVWNTLNDTAMAKGGYLAMIDDQEENDFITSIIPSVRFIGAHDSDLEGAWTWSDGSPLSYSNWGTSQPDNASGADFCTIQVDGTWDDWSGTAVRRGIVEFDSIPRREINTRFGPEPGDILQCNMTTTIGYIVIDEAGNSRRSEIDITVRDTISPTFSCPSNLSEPLNANCEYVVPDFSTIYGPEDNCSADADIIFDQSPAAGTVMTSSFSVILEATDESGNTANCSFMISLPVSPAISVDAGPVSAGICENSTYQTDGTVLNTTIYNWISTGDGSFDDDNLEDPVYTPGPADISAGTVTLTLQTLGSGSCTSASDNIILSIVPALNAGTDSTANVCLTSPMIDLSDYLGGTQDAGGTWTNTNGAAGLTGSLLDPISNAAGTYEFTYVVSGSFYCPNDSSTVIIHLSDGANAGPDNAIQSCSDGAAVNLNSMIGIGASLTGVFVDTALTGALSGSSFDVNASGAGTYLIYYVVSESGCANDTAEFWIDVDQSMTLNAGSDGEICAGSSIALSAVATAADSTAWGTSGDGIFSDINSLTSVYTPGPNDQSLGSAILTLSGFSNGSCSSISDNISISIIPAPIVDAGMDTTICSNATIDLSGQISNYMSLTWSSDGDGDFSDINSLNPTYTPGTNDLITHTVNITLNANGISPCASSTDILTLTIADSVTVDAGPDVQELCESETLVLSGTATNVSSVSWTTNGDGIIDEPFQLNTTYQSTGSDLSNSPIYLVLEGTGDASCSLETDTIWLQIDQAPIVDAGLPTVELCSSIPTYQTNGSASSYDSLQWLSSGDGSFNSQTIEDPIYTIGTTDSINGTVTLRLTAFGLGACAAAIDSIVLDLIPLPEAPNGASIQNFCSIDSATVADLIASGPSTIWYDSETGGNSLASSTPIVNSMNYYAAQIIGGCESNSRLAVTANIIDPIAPTANSVQEFCSIDSAQVNDLSVIGSSILWYSTANGGTALSGADYLTDGDSYYASQTVLGCESINRTMVSVLIADPSAPTGSSLQSFCSMDSAVLSDLTVSGTSVQWYDSALGSGTMNITEPLTDGMTYYASQTISSCESATRLAVTVEITDPAPPTGDAIQVFCSIDSAKVSDLLASGNGITWYDSEIGGNILANGEELTDGATYYASQIISGCESISRLHVLVQITDPEAPTGSENQAFCSIDSPTVSDLMASGTNIQWYLTSAGGTVLQETDILIDGFIYYASQTIDACESVSRFSTTVAITDPSAPAAPSSQQFCAIDSVTISELSVTGTAIQWYSSPNGGSPLNLNDQLTDATTYYATQTVDGCESIIRTAVDVSIADPMPPMGSSSQEFCSINSATVADLITTGTDIQWYDSSSGGNLLPLDELLVDGETYYASQTVSGCESALRLFVNVSLADPLAPTGDATQEFCAIDSPTLNDVSIVGEAILWYNTPSGGSVLSSSDQLLDGITYYASQTVNGCESDERLAITIQIVAPTAPTGTQEQDFCSIDSPTVSDLQASGTDIQWYLSSISTDPLMGTEALLDGHTYLASQTISGCESLERLSVTVGLSAPQAPVATSPQSFCPGNLLTLNDLEISAQNVIWYDSSSGGSMLPASTTLVNGSSYYASQVIDGCESTLRTVVLVNLDDNTDPIAICQDVQLILGEMNPGSAILDPQDVNNGSTDDCSLEQDLFFEIDQINFDCSHVGILNSVMLTVYDAAGNSATCSADVTVLDQSAPALTCVPELTVYTDAMGDSAYILLDSPEVVDNCDNYILYNDYNSLEDASGVYPYGETLITWYAGGNGLSSSCSTLLTVLPTTPPSIDCPEEIIVENDPGLCGGTAFIEVPSTFGPITSIQEQNFGFGNDTSMYLPIGTTELIWIPESEIFQQYTCTTQVVVMDTESPVILDCPSDTIHCGLILNLPMPEVFDNCSYSIENSVGGSSSSGLQFSHDVPTDVIWTVTDGIHTETCVTTVRAHDSSTPAIAGIDQTLNAVYSTQIDALFPSEGIGTWTVLQGNALINDSLSNLTSVENLQSGHNILQWTVESEVCGTSVDELHITVRDFLIPNAFSPNGDGFNDEFHIVGIETIQKNSFTVFNQWGRIVYSVNDYRNDWKGNTSGGGILPSDTYYYILKVQGDENQEFKGYIELRR